MGRARVNKVATRLVVLAMALIVSSGCATEFEQQFAAAQRLRFEAAAAGTEWLETEDLLNQASEAAAQDDMDAAFALLEQARFQAEMANKQAEHEAAAWASRVVR